VDFEGNIADASVQAALDELAGITRSLKIFGSYPSRTSRSEES
jgi:prephenate dehydratase